MVAGTKKIDKYSDKQLAETNFHDVPFATMAKSTPSEDAIRQAAAKSSFHVQRSVADFLEAAKKQALLDAEETKGAPISNLDGGVQEAMHGHFWGEDDLNSTKKSKRRAVPALPEDEEDELDENPPPPTSKATKKKKDARQDKYAVAAIEQHEAGEVQRITEQLAALEIDDSLPENDKRKHKKTLAAQLEFLTAPAAAEPAVPDQDGDGNMHRPQTPRKKKSKRAAGEEHADADTPQKMRKLSAASTDAAAALPKKTQKNAKKSSE